MKYLLGLLIVVCVGWQSCANDNNIIENYSSQKCGMTPEEVEVKIEEIREKYPNIKNWYYEVKDYDSISNQDLVLLEKRIREMSEWVDEQENL
ncbi:hypothetical protein [Bacteroides sp.]|uniref:hypothetical protein n=1 Tax=Bacteroides sp. TaxID=29523 RepID=UPI0025BBCCD2|nr:MULTISPECIES: hypothetical protein [Bacteroides]